MLSRVQEEFEQNGFVVFSLHDAQDLIAEINSDIEGMIHGGEFSTNSRIYQYNNSPRIVESWKHSSAAKQLAFHPEIIEYLTKLFGCRPKPFSTINFVRSTQQPLHSDYIHFGTVPHFRLAAAWVALEDIDPRSGPLQIVRGSHKLPALDYSDLGLPTAKSLGDVKRHYSIYEDFIKFTVNYQFKENVCTPSLKAGDVLIWAANVLHGSPTCEDNRLSRRSQVIHYHFEGTEIFYNPAFSNLNTQKFLKRNVEFIVE
jgi:ectoine hydroxylase-related dioxygenase (phytanoyl-CoA dioxygenase family)